MLSKKPCSRLMLLAVLYAEDFFLLFGWGYNLPWQELRRVIFPSEWKHRYKQKLLQPPPPHLPLQSVRLLLVQALGFIQAIQLQVQSFKLMFTPTSGRFTFLNASVYVQSTVGNAIIMIPSPAQAWILQCPLCREESAGAKVHNFRSQPWNKKGRVFRSSCSLRPGLPLHFNLLLKTIKSIEKLYKNPQAAFVNLFHICLFYSCQKVFRSPCRFALHDLSNTDIYCSFSFSSLKANPLNDQKPHTI